MPRISKCRKVCTEFRHKVFSPEEKENGYVILSVDELEALRLSDLENIDQDAAAGKMGVSRGTFQRILYAARHKSVEALCNGKGILIQGGHYEVAGGNCKCELKCKFCRRKFN